MEEKGVPPVVQHLTELRKRIIIVAIVFVLSMCVGLYFAPTIINYIKQGPRLIDVDWNVFAFTDGIVIYMRCALLFALLITVPLILYHVWKFAEPGLTEPEASGTKKYIPISFVLFLGGTAFAYYVIFPLMIQFLSGVNHSIGATEVYGLTNFFSLLFRLVFPVAMMFEMPIIVLFLTRLGILTPARMKVSRKFTYVLLAVISSAITPPDFISHLSVLIPLIILFEISLICSKVYLRKLAIKSRGQSE